MIRLVRKSIKGRNYLTVIVRAHYVIDRVLEHAIRTFSLSPSKEIARLPFALKVELALTLGVIQETETPLFRTFNKLRNRIAHNPFTKFQKKDFMDIVNCLSIDQKRLVLSLAHTSKLNDLTNRKILEHSIVAMFSLVGGSIRQKLDASVAATMRNEEIGPLVRAIVESDPEYFAKKDRDFAEKLAERTRRLATFPEE